ncbi:MAG: hypothetical protein OXN23_05620 [Gammaproteobacteria bacterium]|nr:hypothetical protein [Gammaproteobacteria bacterium]MDE0302503.1 hypothetical protein [Gammaproteobacteria bacterium]
MTKPEPARIDAYGWSRVWVDTSVIDGRDGHGSCSNRAVPNRSPGCGGLLIAMLPFLPVGVDQVNLFREFPRN